MTTETTLTFGDDGSPHSDTAWAWIDSHHWTGWRLEVVAAQAPVVPPVEPERVVLHPWEPDRPRLPSARTGFASVVHLTADLDPRLALSRPTGLLVVGPRGPGLLKALHLGSTAEWLIHHPPAPLVVPHSEGPVREVLVAHDGSPHADEAVAALCRLPWAKDVHAAVLAVEDGRVDAVATVQRAADALVDGGIDAEAIVRAGRPTDVILHEAERAGADLLVLGTRGLTGLRRLRVGSTASAVSRAARCSVLLACHEQPHQPDQASPAP